MLLTDNGKIILGSTRAAKPKRKTSRKVSRKRRSVKRKVSRKVSRKRRSVKRKASRKRRSAKRKASRKKKSAKRKASRKKTRNSPPSGVIKKQNLGVGSVMVGQDGKTMYKVVEITMRGKPVKKWAKMKFKMGQLFCSGKDDAACLLEKEKIAAHSMLEKNIKVLKEARVELKESIKDAEKVVKETEKRKLKTNKRLLEADKAKLAKIIKRNLAGQKIMLEKFLKKYKKILEGMKDKLDQLNKTITVMEKGKDKLGEELLVGDHGGERRGLRGRRQ
jgi:hypothetical protein